MVRVAGAEATGAVARTPLKPIFLPVLPTGAACWDRNRMPKAEGALSAAGLAAGLARVIASRENMAIVWCLQLRCVDAR